MLEVLDFCDTARSAARRGVTSVPTQALTLLNGDFVNRQARHLADRLERDAGPDPAAQIERAYLLHLCRLPREAERSALLAFLNREAQARHCRSRRSPAHRLTAAQARHEALVQALPRDLQHERVCLSGLAQMTPTSSRFIPNPTPCGRSRREFLWEVGGGFAGLGLIDLLSRSGFFSSAQGNRDTRRIGLGDTALLDVAQTAALSRRGPSMSSSCS